MVALLVALTFVSLLIIDGVIKKQAEKKAVRVTQKAGMTKHSFAFPLGYFFSPGHVWVNLKSTGSLRVGLDELVQTFLGHEGRIMLKKPGDTINKGETLAVLSKGEKELHVLSPVAGRIQETNSNLEEHPEALSDNPYEKGWFYEVTPFQFDDDIRDLKVAYSAKSWLKDEFQKLKDFIQLNQPQVALANQTLSDGGILADGLIDHLDQRTVENFEQNFLMNPQEQL
jgi:glycine cleavage system H protein